MLETVGNKRRASIILDGGELSPYFVLEAGRPQGEILSPNQYNIGQQIVLFRLELDTEIKSVFQHFMKLSNPFSMLQHESHSSLKFVCESERETDKAEGFADDTSVLALLSQENLVNIKLTLLQFSRISGLKCNFEKSFIIPLNNMRNLGPIDNLDLKVANSFTLLGMEIDSNLELLSKNFDKTI